MNRIVSTSNLCLVFALVCAGCPSDDASPSDGSSGTAMTDDGTSTNAATTSGPTTIGADTTGVDTTAGSTTEPGSTTAEMTTTGTNDTDVDTDTDADTDSDTDTDSGTTSDGATTTDGGAGICDPDPMDDPCFSCMRSSCCTELEACELDGDASSGCQCYANCVEGGGGPIGECDSMCMVDVFDAGTATGVLGSCAIANCLASCAP